MTYFYEKLKQAADQNILPHKYVKILEDFFESYLEVLKQNKQLNWDYLNFFSSFLDQVLQQFQHRYEFEPYHQAIRVPFDYYKFGLDFLRPLVDFKHSTLIGETNVQKMEEQLKCRENVILFANHQIEADPQAISLMLEDKHPKVAEEMTFVAGDRVITDPLAIPFSMGRNLFCIYSKKHINNPPEMKVKKQLHNRKTMHLLTEHLAEGGCCIYVAPSGGRDRMNQQGEIHVSQFDPQSVEMFYLLAKKAKRPSHFYPLALSTYDLLPPPNEVEKELGEKRTTKGGAIHLSFGDEIEMENIPTFSKDMDKLEKRQMRTEYIWHLVSSAYETFPKHS